MAHNHNGGGFDPRLHPNQQHRQQHRPQQPQPQQQQQYGNYYDPRYQQQPYPPPVSNFQIQIPMAGAYGYPSMQQQQQQPPPPPPPPPQQSPRQVPQQSLSMYQAPTQQFYQQSVYAAPVQSPQYHTPPVQQRQQQQHSPPPPQQQYQSPIIQHQSPPLQRSTLPHMQHHQRQQLQQQQQPSPQMQQQPLPTQPQPPPPTQQQQQSRQRQFTPQSPAAPVMNGHVAQPSPKPAPRPQPQPSPVSLPSPAPAAAPAQIPAPAPPPPRSPTPMNLDYTALMIDLAERYFEAAYGNGTKAAPGFRQNPDTFCRLIATGLACFDVILGELRSSLQPPMEAAVRLRYASVLYKETENYMDAEEMLSKGMSLCDRFRLTDLKYNMQHLLARVTFLKNPKAAVRYLDGIVRDVEAVNHIPWVYAMRFLRAALSLQMGLTQEILTAISQLKVISSMATSRKDYAVAAVANGLEAMIHIHRSTSTDSIEQSQQSLATVRSAQLGPAAQSIYQLKAMTYFVDVLCSVYPASSNEATAKMMEMNTFLDQTREDTAWTTDGEFLVPLSETTSQQCKGAASESGVVHLGSNGQLSLRFQWIPKDEIYTLAYVLSASVVMTKNPHDGHQAESYLQQAQKTLKINDKGNDGGWRKRQQSEIQAQMVFTLCGRSAWGVATKELQPLKALVEEQPDNQELSMSLLVSFLEASILQGTGETEKALEIYMQEGLSLANIESVGLPSIAKDLCILAALNVLLITCLPNHPRYSDFDGLLSKLEPLILEHPSKDMQAAYNLVRAVSLNTGPDIADAESASMLKTKQYLQQALQSAKRTGNNQLCCITLNFMSWRYFRGVVGEQPVKSAMSAQALARKGQNSLWMSVADGLLADTLETQGRNSEADTTRQESLDLAEKLPALMQRDVDLPRM